RRLIVSAAPLRRRAKRLRPRIWQEVGAADGVVHAGGWVSPQLLDEWRSASHHLVGVHGNNDGPELRQQLPEVARLELGGLRFAVVHETSPAKGRERRCDERFPDTDVLIFGHSHIPWDSTTPNGMQLLPPGPPTARRRHPHHPSMTAELADGEHDVHLHRLD